MTPSMMPMTGTTAKGANKPLSLARKPTASNTASGFYKLGHLIGNRAIGQLIQAKLSIGQPNDKYEQEADRVAEQVMRMPDPGAVQTQTSPPNIQRFCSQCTDGLQRQQEDEEEDDLIQAKTAAGQAPQLSDGVASQIQRLKGGGQALDASTRAFMEPRFGRDFGAVRVHVDGRAASLARKISAKAFTLGSDIVFGAGQYSSGASESRCLLAHELTHVIQQRVGGGARQVIYKKEANNAGSSSHNAFKSAKVKSSKQVQYLGQEKTAELMDKALAQSTILGPYLKKKMKNISIAGNKFKIAETNADFERKFIKLHEIKGSNDELEKAAETVYGFYNRATDTIYLRPTSTIGHALHESIHKLSDATFRPVFGGFLDEGVTQYFTDQILLEQKLGKLKKHRYRKQLGCAGKLVSLFDMERIANAYFLGLQVNDVRLDLMKKINVDDHGAFARLSVKGVDGLCKKINSAKD